MTSKTIQEFTQLNEAYKVLDKFYFGEDGGESPLDELDNAFWTACSGESDKWREFTDLIEKAKELVGEAMDIAVKRAGNKLKQVG